MENILFIDRLIEKVIEKNNPSILGLDPQLEYIPDFFKKAYFSSGYINLKSAAQIILEFNKAIIDSVHEYIPAVKLQLAYYEMYGVEGMKAFYETLQYSKKKDLIIIADGKRNDIGPTAYAYSNAYLGKTNIDKDVLETAFDADALTVNPYLGIDGIEPFIQTCKKYGKGIFILVKTSNPSSGQIQDLETKDGSKIYEVLATYVDSWGKDLLGKYGYSSIGAVVGATYPEQAKSIRKIIKKGYILVPGYGTQGSTAQDASSSFNPNGFGAVVNASRSIMYAYNSPTWKNEFSELEFDKAAKAECLRMKDDLMKFIPREQLTERINCNE